eukprot:910886_1
MGNHSSALVRLEDSIQSEDSEACWKWLQIKIGTLKAVNPDIDEFYLKEQTEVLLAVWEKLSPSEQLAALHKEMNKLSTKQLNLLVKHLKMIKVSNSAMMTTEHLSRRNSQSESIQSSKSTWSSPTHPFEFSDSSSSDSEIEFQSFRVGVSNFKSKPNSRNPNPDRDNSDSDLHSSKSDSLNPKTGTNNSNSDLIDSKLYKNSSKPDMNSVRSDSRTSKSDSQRFSVYSNNSKSDSQSSDSNLGEFLSMSDALINLDSCISTQDTPSFMSDSHSSQPELHMSKLNVRQCKAAVGVSCSKSDGYHSDSRVSNSNNTNSPKSDSALPKQNVATEVRSATVRIKSKTSAFIKSKFKNAATGKNVATVKNAETVKSAVTVKNVAIVKVKSNRISKLKSRVNFSKHHRSLSKKAKLRKSAKAEFDSPRSAHSASAIIGNTQIRHMSPGARSHSAGFSVRSNKSRNTEMSLEMFLFDQEDDVTQNSDEKPNSVRDDNKSSNGENNFKVGGRSSVINEPNYVNMNGSKATNRSTSSENNNSPKFLPKHGRTENMSRSSGSLDQPSGSGVIEHDQSSKHVARQNVAEHIVKSGDNMVASSEHAVGSNGHTARPNGHAARSNGHAVRSNGHAARSSENEVRFSENVVRFSDHPSRSSERVERQNGYDGRLSDRASSSDEHHAKPSANATKHSEQTVRPSRRAVKSSERTVKKSAVGSSTTTSSERRKRSATVASRRLSVVSTENRNPNARSEKVSSSKFRKRSASVSEESALPEKSHSFSSTVPSSLLSQQSFWSIPGVEGGLTGGNMPSTSRLGGSYARRKSSEAPFSRDAQQRSSRTSSEDPSPLSHLRPESADLPNSTQKPRWSTENTSLKLKTTGEAVSSDKFSYMKQIRELKQANHRLLKENTHLTTKITNEGVNWLEML